MSKKLPLTPVKTTKKTTTAKTAKRSKGGSVRIPTLGDDFRNALLVVSVLINLVVLITWLALRLTDVYDDQVWAFLFNR